MKMRENVFITGGTGFIGKCIVNKLLECENLNLSILSRNNYNNGHKLQYIKGNILDFECVEHVIKNADYVIHLAGNKNNPNSYYQTNVEGTRNVIKACSANQKLKKLLYLSSVGVIGKTKDSIIDENSYCNPQNDYEISKYKAELLVQEYSKKVKGRVIILRPTNVFGENDPDLHLLNLLRSIINHRFYVVGSDVSRYYLNYLYVREISELVPSLLEAKTKNDLYILNTPTRLYDFIMIIKEILKDKTPLRHLPYWPVWLIARCFDFIPQKIMRHQPINTNKLSELTNVRHYSSSLLSADLEWEPKFKMEEALLNVIAYYQNKLMI